MGILKLLEVLKTVLLAKISSALNGKELCVSKELGLKVKVFLI
jgi:hypothetical protein